MGDWRAPACSCSFWLSNLGNHSSRRPVGDGFPSSIPGNPKTAAMPSWGRDYLSMRGEDMLRRNVEDGVCCRFGGDNHSQGAGDVECKRFKFQVPGE